MISAKTIDSEHVEIEMSGSTRDIISEAGVIIKNLREVLEEDDNAAINGPDDFKNFMSDLVDLVNEAFFNEEE